MTPRNWQELLAATRKGDGNWEGAAADALVEQAAEAMRRRFGADRKRVCHAMRVLRNVEALLPEALPVGQGWGDATVSARLCAVLHDIGIQRAERLHGSSAARYQELEGPPIAREILTQLSAPEWLVERVCHVVGHHHTASAVDAADFQLLWEADLLVNLVEDSFSDSPTLRTALRRNLCSPGSAALTLERLGIDLGRADL